jgi:UDP:flavonoid glycosyltransferase YjiC (YdhE family)
MADILFVTWDGGGNVPPATAIARELQGRGHTVRFLGHAGQEEQLTSAGFEFVAARHARDFRHDATYSAVTMMAVFGDRGMGRDLLDVTARRPPDLVVVDCLMVGALRAAADAGLRFAVLQHLYDANYRSGILGGPMGLSLRLRRLRPHQTIEAAAARVLTTVPALDRVPAPPANLHQVGPVVDVAPREPAEHPTILVSLSTFGYPGMTGSLQKILDATRALDARVVVTTGPLIDPDDLQVPDGTEVHRYVPHVELMPSATLFVGHGGHGSTMQALAHDLPVVVMPLEPRGDQPFVGRSLIEAGAGRVVGRRTPPDEIAGVLAELLADGPHRAAAARVGATIRSLPGAVGGADVLDDLVRDGAPERGLPADRP